MAALPSKLELKKTNFNVEIRAKATTDNDEPIGIEEARTLLGHSTQSMTGKYMRDRNGHLSGAINWKFNGSKYKECRATNKCKVDRTTAFTIHK